MELELSKLLGVSCLAVSALGWAHTHASEPVDTPKEEIISFHDSDIATVLQRESGSSIFTDALKSSEIWQRIRNMEKATIFVVSNSSLRQEGSAFLLEEVLITKDNSERLNNMLAQHVIPNIRIELSNLSTPTKFANLHLDCILVEPLHNATKVGPEAYVTKSIETNNGNIHFIDRLLWIPYLAEEKRGC